MIKKVKKGFSLLVAISIIVLLSLVSAYIIYASSHITKSGQIQYQREQAIILARSYTEYAVMAIQGNNREVSSTCISKITSDIGEPEKGQGYRVEVVVRYIGAQKYLKNCSSNTIISTLNDSDTDSLFAIIDVYVKYKDILHKNIGTYYEYRIPWQTYHKRSIQKI